MRERTGKGDGGMMARLSFIEGEYRYFCSPETRWPAKNAGFRFRPQDEGKGGPCWWTTDPTIAKHVANVGDKSALDELRRILAERKGTLDASRALHSDIDVPVPDGLELYPFQKAGVAFAMKRPNTLLGDEMGLEYIPFRRAAIAFALRLRQRASCR